MKIREVLDIWRHFPNISILTLQYYAMNSRCDVPYGAYVETWHPPGAPLVVLKGTEATALAFRSVRLHLVL
jgi:hypothetical protein